MSETKITAQPLAPNLIAAALSALVAVAFAGSFGSLVFGGPLEPFVGRAVLAALVGCIVINVGLSLRSSFYFTIGGPEANPSAIIAFTLAAISGEILHEPGATPLQLVPTALAFLFLSATGCGIVLYAFGQCRWGRYVRYIPHPVVGGFLASTGYLLIAGACKMLTGQPLGLHTPGAIAGLHPLAWITALVVAVSLFVLSRRVHHFLVIPGVLIGAMVGFHLARVACGLDVTAARELGMLLAPLQVGEWTHAGNFPYREIRWDLLFHHGKDFAAMTTVAIITALLNTTSLELASGIESDADRELKSLGLANLLVGVCGGMVSVNSFSRSILNRNAGANSPWATRGCAALILAIMLLVPGAIGLLPKPVLTGLILFLGVTMLVAWTIDARRTMPASEHLIVLTIIVIVAWLGMVPGVVLGLVIACVSFVFTLSRSPTIRGDFTLRDRRSNVERPAPQAEILLAQGDAMRGFALQGFLFFGTTTRVLDEVRAALHKTRFVLLDFRLVQGIDGSSGVALKKLKSLCQESRIPLGLAGLSPDVQATLHRGNFGLDDPQLHLFPDLDRALEWCEDRLIAEAIPHSALLAAFSGVLTSDEVSYLLSHFDRVHVAAGALLLRQGDASDSMFIVEQGRVSVYLHVDEGDARRLIRLRTYSVGTVVGEMGLYTGATRSADIVADEPTVALQLTAARMEELERAMPELAKKLHRFVVRSLSVRLAAANAEIRALM